MGHGQRRKASGSWDARECFYTSKWVSEPRLERVKTRDASRFILGCKEKVSCIGVVVGTEIERSRPGTLPDVPLMLQTVPIIGHIVGFLMLSRSCFFQFGITQLLNSNLG
jgi:hypothetical protein